jgi:hypothetical protein
VVDQYGGPPGTPSAKVEARRRYPCRIGRRVGHRAPASRAGSGALTYRPGPPSRGRLPDHRGRSRRAAAAPCPPRRRGAVRAREGTRRERRSSPDRQVGARRWTRRGRRAGRNHCGTGVTPRPVFHQLRPGMNNRRPRQAPAAFVHLSDNRMNGGSPIHEHLEVRQRDGIAEEKRPGQRPGGSSATSARCSPPRWTPTPSALRPTTCPPSAATGRWASP